MGPFNSLMQATEKALLYVHRKRKQIPGAVNWADLGCVEVQKVTAFDGDELREFWKVVVEEVSPEAYEFSEAVAERLKKLGFPEVEVECEW